jgi:hypothetical protein
MATIYQEIHGLQPKMERKYFDEIVVRMAANKGKKETDDSKFFSQLWMPFAWAAILGFQNDKSKELDTIKIKKDTFQYSTIFNNSERIFNSLILFAIAKKGHAILEDISKLNKTIEEYANGGFELLNSKLDEKPDFFDDDNNYISYLLESI